MIKYNLDENGNPRINNENKKQYNVKILCIMTELIYRYYEKIQYNNKKWFVTTEFATVSNFEEKSK